MIGMARRIDQLGRLVVPAEFRKLMGIEPGDLLDMRVDQGRLTISKMTPECAMCGNANDLMELHDKQICGDCVRAIRLEPECAICQRVGSLVELNGKHVCNDCVREISHV
jgi:transcriptional pleiotropic regulator of transition state genes